MKIKVLLFATLRQRAGWKEREWQVGEGSTVADLAAVIDGVLPELGLTTRVYHTAVNEEYVEKETVLSEGDTVGFFPPVSGGTNAADAGVKFFEIVERPLSLEEVAARVTRPDCGAIALFSGVVRGSTRVQGAAVETDFLAYEAYAEMAEKMMARIGDEVRERWQKVADIAMMHRVGRLEIGEPSVVIAVTTPHRGDGCFEACQYAIERLKEIVPIWKQENGRDGSVWIEGPRNPERS